MGMTGVTVLVASAAGGNAQALIHGDEGHETDHDGDSQQQVAVRLHHDKANAIRFVFAEEDFRQEVEQRIAH